MDRSIIDFPALTSAAAWRAPEQLRGLLRHHPDVVTRSTMLFSPSRFLTAACLALHSTESVLAIALTPLMSGGLVGLMPLSGTEPSLNGASRIRWMDVPEGAPAACMDWCDDTLLVGSSRGRVWVTVMGAESCAQSSGLLEPCHSLVTEGVGVAVGDITVPPSSHAATTLVRSLRINRFANKKSVVGVQGNSGYIWDLGGGGEPVRQWSPHGALDDPAVLLFARWAPDSDNVVLTGSYDGSLLLVDTRVAGDRNGLLFSTGNDLAIGSGEFNPILPYVFCAASSDGTFSLFDVRYSTSPMQSIPSLQGDVAAIAWHTLQPDMLTTAGTDGTVSLWNLRYSPTYCVGRSQFQCPLTDVLTTQTCVEQRSFVLTVGGELGMVSLSPTAIMALAPDVTCRMSEGGAVGGDSLDANHIANMHASERQACGLLYARYLRKAYSLLAQCASARLALQDPVTAMRLVGLADEYTPPPFDYEMHLTGRRAKSMESRSLGLAEAQRAFRNVLARSAERLCSSVPLHRLRNMLPPDAVDLKRLDALRLNVLLQQVRQEAFSGNPIAGVNRALEHLSKHPSSFECVEVDLVCDIVVLLLRKHFSEGERFVRQLLSLLIRPDGTAVSNTMARRVLKAAQHPLITEGLSDRNASRFEKSCLSDLLAAQDAVLTQFVVLRMGVENFSDVIATVNDYQGRCISKNLPAFARFPAVQQVETVFFSVLSRIHKAGSNIAADLARLAAVKKGSLPVVRQAETSLRTAHAFLTVLLRVQLETENVAISGHLTGLPPVMVRVQEILSAASEAVLVSWEELLRALSDYEEAELVRKYCLATVREFLIATEDLVDISSQKDDDELLNDILDTCDEFLEAVGLQ